ncbi:hypothetical protein FZC78_12010 [Rossellomorea vietnamensis]|uniref:Lipoprotein n=1 Tax=Rossellomorea vietnamensis TaxID=218284 RepID=A0A5D4NTR2_9BACI|nr:hypothetical protein [Rossellomorea vietnamensis]TYS16706.1 hypothetical protein FZC78_12010 [Rossellomorea vietnamensis]
MKKGVLLTLILLSLFTLGSCSNETDRKPNYAEKGKGVVIHVQNQLQSKIDHIQLEIYQEGKMLSSSGTVHADGSPIKKGEDLEFEILEEDLPLEGTAEIIVLVTETNGDSTKKINNSVTVDLSKGREHFLVIQGENAGNTILKKAR